MKKTILLALFALWLTGTVSFAQSEGAADSIPPISLDGSRYKSFDGFLLDMEPIQAAPQLVTPRLPYRPYNDNGTVVHYNELFRPGRNVTYDRVMYDASFLPFFPSGALQSATYRLGNGMRIITYGEYDANGYRVRNPGALPWERNHFRGAFEVKSRNGNFGIRVEMQGGRATPW